MRHCHPNRFLSGALLLALAVPCTAQTIQLKSGKLLVGQVQDPDGSGFSYKRLDNGGLLRLRWDQLSSESATRLKELFNLSTDDESEVMVNADVIVYTMTGGSTEEVVGKIVGRKEDVLEVRTKAGVMPIRRENVKSVFSREVPALDVLTREEFYQEKLAEIAPGDDADLHIKLADVLMRARDYDHAEQHLKRAVDLHNTKQPAKLEHKLQRLELYKGARQERELLDEIKARRARDDFKKGRELIAQFEKTFPNSKLKMELEAEKDRFEKARARALTASVTEQWYRDMRGVILSTKANSGISLAQARAWAEAEAGKEIRKAIAERSGLAEDEVGALWAKRQDYPGIAKSSLYSYGEGSWVLGEKDILKDTPQIDQKEKPKQADPDERLQRKIQDALDRARKANRQQGGGEKGEVTDEDWWKQASHDQRTFWLITYYAEHGGDLKVMSADAIPCKNCSGLGFIEAIGDTGKPVKHKCPSCHGTRYLRRIRVE